MRSFFIATVVGAFALLPASAGGVSERAAANRTVFEDSRGEQPAPAPDITNVVVSNTNAGLISFQINVLNRVSLSEDMLVVIDIDADNNPRTGDPESSGADYAIQLFQGSADLFRWDGQNFTRRQGDPPQTSLIFQGLTIKINASELGNTKQFNFATFVITGIRVDRTTGDVDFSQARGDIAPDLGHGLWKYAVKTTPLRLNVRRFSVSAARAGGTLTARMVAVRNDTGARLTGGTVTCVATVGGARLVGRGRFVGSEARCTWRIPASARGKVLRGSITVSFEGKRARKSFTRTVG